MREKQPASSYYQISDVKVYSELNTIEVKGETHRVEPKVMALLNYLSDHQGEVCSKQTLIEAIWPNQIIADEALTRLIFVLRNVLGDEAKAPKFIATVPKKGYVLLEPVTLPKPLMPKKWLPVLVALVLVSLVSLWFVLYQPASEYKIVKSTPITFLDGREYGFVEGSLLSAYFHQYQGSTKLMVAENGGPYSELVDDKWLKRSLQLVDNKLFYIRFNDSESQIIRQTLLAEPEVLFSSSQPIYHLSLNNKEKSLLFNQYKDNANTALFSLSLIDRQVQPLGFNTSSVPNVIKQHFYDDRTEQLVFVGIQSRLPVIYGYRAGDVNYQFEIKRFDNINGISVGKDKGTLLVAGSYQQIRGIWSVDVTSSEVTLLLNANDGVISGVYLSLDEQSIYYSLENHRQDIIAVDWQGTSVALPHLNSTLKDSHAQYSAGNESIYFTSDRSGSRELYQYDVSSQLIKQITNIQASAIWHYSFSHDRDRLAIVYSTDQIQLGVIDVETGKPIRSIILDEIKFPLAWSKDNQFIYVSEHRSQIAMYLYDVNALTIKQKQPHLGLSAVEVGNKEIIAFDYTSDQFVRYRFDDNTGRPISPVLPNSAQLAPNRVYVDQNQAYIIETHNDEQQLKQVEFSEVIEKTNINQLGGFKLKANILAINPHQRELLFLKDYNTQNGSIIELMLQR